MRVVAGCWYQRRENPAGVVYVNVIIVNSVIRTLTQSHDSVLRHSPSTPKCPLVEAMTSHKTGTALLLANGLFMNNQRLCSNPF